MMKNFGFIFILIVLFNAACKTNSTNTQNTPSEASDFGTAAYYQKYQRNIDRLYHMLQGTFICYSQSTEKEAKLIPWKVNNQQDSVITYSVPIKEPAKDGYWLICYQFITSLPDEPIYCAVQKITPVDRDTFLSEFFDSPAEIKLTKMIKDLKTVEQSIDLEQLTPIDEVVTYYREKITFFKGFSNIYKDHQNQNLTYRQENYEVHPENTQFATRYFKDINGDTTINKASNIAIEIRTSKPVSEMIDQTLLGK
ncbi:hypothetical protein [Aureispira sp. CCB-QB1]|uniref:hypothetical protein n=1 Tax=Aureispira sp. CCB-QB1 TaxID=1313421 RepID=UPI0012DF0DDE|nr:hypothetical protein [Aureispira sp. CCB-QB1]